MFFLKELTHTIQLHPSYFSSELRNYIKTKLHADVEGKCTGRYGYIITVVNLTSISSGRIIPSTGLAEFDVSYNAVVLKPFKGETMDAVVVSVNSQGFFANVGPLSIFVSQLNLPPFYSFDESAHTPSFRGDNQVIQKGEAVRIKLISTRMDASSIVAIGSVQDDFLGLVKN